MTRAATLLAVLLLAGCATERRCQRLYPPAAYTTVTVRDTVVVTPAVRADTHWVAQPTDTLVLERERLRVEVVRHRDTLRLAAECRPDTLYIPRVREVVRYSPSPTPQTGLPGWVWALGAALVVAGLARLLR